MRGIFLLGVLQVLLTYGLEIGMEAVALLRGMEIAAVSVVAEFQTVMTTLKSVHFEAPIYLLLVLVAENLIGLVTILLSSTKSLKTLVAFGFRGVDMSRDLLELRSDYGLFRWI